MDNKDTERSKTRDMMMAQRWNDFQPMRYLVNSAAMSLSAIAVALAPSVLFNTYSFFTGVLFGLIFALLLTRAKGLIVKRKNESDGVVKRNQEILASLGKYTDNNDLALAMAVAAASEGYIDIYSKTLEDSLNSIRDWHRKSEKFKLKSDCSKGHSAVCKHRSPELYQWLTEK